MEAMTSHYAVGDVVVCCDDCAARGFLYVVCALTPDRGRVRARPLLGGDEFTLYVPDSRRYKIITHMEGWTP
jgi:hypothetical protein